MLADRRGDGLAENMIFRPDLVDVVRVEDHGHHLIDQVRELLVARRDALLLGDLRLDPSEHRVAQAFALHSPLRLVGHSAVSADVLLEHRLEVQADLFVADDLDLLAFGQRANELTSDLRDLT